MKTFLCSAFTRCLSLGLLVGFAALAQAASPIKLYVTHRSATTTADRLDRMDIDGANLSTLASDAGNFGQPEAIHIDYANGVIFMVNGAAGKRILRFDLNGGSPSLIHTVTHTGIARGMALDRDNRRFILPLGLRRTRMLCSMAARLTRPRAVRRRR